jgi:hypothetical protein
LCELLRKKDWHSWIVQRFTLFRENTLRQDTLNNTGFFNAGQLHV